MFRQPCFEDLCMVNPQVIQDQVNLPLCALDQPLAEIHQQIGIHAALEDAEAHLALIIDCRDHVDGNPFRIEPYDRRLALGRVAPFMLTVVAYPGLIAPVDLCLLGLGLCLDLGVTLIQPLLNRLGILLISPPDGLLGRKAPAFQVLTDRADRHRDSGLLLDQFHHGLAGPQGMVQFQLIGSLVRIQTTDTILLGRIQVATLTRLAAATLASATLYLELLWGQLEPATDRIRMHAHNW